jgi:hypothetical protein
VTTAVATVAVTGVAMTTVVATVAVTGVATGAAIFKDRQGKRRSVTGGVYSDSNLLIVNV